MRKYFITGLLVWIPLIITVWVLKLLNGWMDASLLLIPKSYLPETLLGFYVPGVGVVLTIALLFVTGLLTANILGHRMLLLWESLLARIPVVKTIYGGVKQVSDTLFSGQGQAFRKALLVRYPHQGAWAVEIGRAHV